MVNLYRRIMGRKKNSLLEDVQILCDYVEDQKIGFDTVSKARRLMIEYKQLLDEQDIQAANEPEIDFSTAEMLALKDPASSKTSFKSRNNSIIHQLIDVEVELTKCISTEEYAGVTIDTLRATGGVDGDRYFRSPMGLYLMMLWAIMFALIFFAMYCDFFITTFSQRNPDLNAIADGESSLLFFYEYLNPFVFGMLGANVYLMRITSTRLSGRTFNPARLPEHFNRLFLGAVSGGVTILFLEDGVAMGGANEGVAMSSAAIGFIAGYSIEFLYQILDRIIGAILPSVKDQFSLELYNRKKRSLMVKKFEREIQVEKAKGDGADKTKLETLEQIVAELNG